MIILSKKIANFQNSVRYGLSALPYFFLYQEHLYALPYHCLIDLKIYIFIYVCVFVCELSFLIILLLIYMREISSCKLFNASFLL